MLGIRSSLNADHPHSPAEMLYGSCLRLPGKYFLEPSPLPTNNQYLNQLKNFVNNLQPVKSRGMTSRRTYIDKNLEKCFHVFVRQNGDRASIQRPYNRPFKVLHKTNKYFTLQLSDNINNVCIDRLKPANLLENFSNDILEKPKLTSVSRSCSRKQSNGCTAYRDKVFAFAGHDEAAPTKQAKSNLITTTTTRRGRVIHKPRRHRQ